MFFKAAEWKLLQMTQPGLQQQQRQTLAQTGLDPPISNSNVLAHEDI